MLYSVRLDEGTPGPPSLVHVHIPRRRVQGAELLSIFGPNHPTGAELLRNIPITTWGDEITPQLIVQFWAKLTGTVRRDTESYLIAARVYIQNSTHHTPSLRNVEGLKLDTDEPHTLRRCKSVISKP